MSNWVDLGVFVLCSYDVYRWKCCPSEKILVILRSNSGNSPRERGKYERYQMANHSPVKKRLQAEPDFALRAGIFIVCWIPDLFENHSNYYKTIGREWRDFHSILGKNATPRATYRQSDEAQSTENPYVAFLRLFLWVTRVPRLTIWFCSLSTYIWKLLPFYSLRSVSEHNKMILDNSQSPPQAPLNGNHVLFTKVTFVFDFYVVFSQFSLFFCLST